MVDLRPMLNETASRLLFTKHPRQVNEYAKMKTLQNAINMVPGKAQRQANRLGDCFSKITSRQILHAICEDYDEPIVAKKEGVERLYMGTMATASQKSRRALARRLAIKGFSFYPDNVGRVSSMHDKALHKIKHITLQQKHSSLQHNTQLHNTTHYIETRRNTLKHIETL